MANNTKLERISIELARRLNDAYTAEGTEITTGDMNGKVVSAAARMAYINKAMFKLFNDVWMLANNTDPKNAKQIFAGIFPELVVTRTGTTDPNSVFAIATPNADYFQLLEATINSSGTTVVQAELIPSHLYLTAKSGRTIQAKGTALIPVVVEIGGSIYFLPAGTELASRAIVLTFIKQPLQPETTGSKVAGTFLTMDASTSDDSPFGNQWNSKLAEIAEQLFRIDAKE